MISLIQKVTGIDKDQVVPATLAAFFFFCIMSGYYILQPMRDEIGLLVGKDMIPKLFLITPIVMLVANPIYSYFVNRISRIRFMKLIYRFFAINVLIFIGIMKYLEATGQMNATGAADLVKGPAFYVAVCFYLWVSVFNLFAMAVFWALMADLYSGSAGKKVFGFVGAGGTLGQFIISGLAAKMVVFTGPTNLLFVTVVFLELGVQAMLRLTRGYVEPERQPDQKKDSVFDSVGDIVRSKYLLGICLYLLFYTFTSTFIYFQKTSIVSDALSDRAARYAFFSQVNFAVSGLTLFIQLFLTGRLLPLVGLGIGLAFVPTVTMGGFILLAYVPTLTSIAIVDIFRKTANYAVSRPSRELLYTAVSRREKYLAKGFIDTFVYRGGDAIASITYDAIKAAGAATTVLSVVAIPISVLYFILSLALGKAHGVKMKALEDPTANDPPPSP